MESQHKLKNIEVRDRLTITMVNPRENEEISIISITDPGMNHPELGHVTGVNEILKLRFYDEESGDNTITMYDAIQIKHFVDDNINKVDTIYVNCDGGVSRSSAVAAALLKYMGLDDSKIWKNGKYSPNRLVYETLAIVLKLDCNTIEDNFEINLKAWKELNDI